MYYIAIEAYDASEDTSFSILASTPQDITIIPCRPTPAPDGVVLWGPEIIATNPTSSFDGQGYEICATNLVPTAGGAVQQGTLDVSLEVCSGGKWLMIESLVLSLEMSYL